MSNRLIFPIGFDLDSGVKQASSQWKNTYRKQLQSAINSSPLKAKIELDARGIDISSLREFTKISKEAVAAAKANAQVQQANAQAQRASISVTERQAMAEQKVATARERTRLTTAKRTTAEERLTQAKLRTSKMLATENQAYATQGSYIQRLIQRMGVYIGLHQAVSFLRSIRDVTAQFEMQRVALGSLIGDLNEANKLFGEIKQAAVKSPFQIKELVTYTKQLAAYKVEQEDLFETTQRLADISAGLGVGMERLILAYGQIRATGYLRASEVRQLTEAGIPIVEELAKKLTTLNGELVSAGDVMKMISERAISFSMVKDVFDGMTDAGGMFYNMQERQAETLLGRWNNLKDSISIMYDEIGRSKVAAGGINLIIKSVKGLADNWNIVLPILLAVADAYAFIKIVPLFQVNAAKSATLASRATHKYEVAVRNLAWAQEQGNAALIKSAQSQLAYATAMKTANAKTNVFARTWARLTAWIKANPWTAAITALVILATTIVSVVLNATKLRRELKKIDEETSVETTKSINNFNRLANIINSTASSTKEHRDAMEELKRSYGELLPAQDDKIEALIREKDGVEAVTNAIREKIEVQQKEKKINAISDEYGEDIAEAEKELTEALSKQFDAATIGAIIAGIKERKSEFGEKTLLKGANVQDILAFKNVLKDVLGEASQEIPHNIVAAMAEEARDLTYALREMEDDIKDVEEAWVGAGNYFRTYSQLYIKFKEKLKETSGEGQLGTFAFDESYLNNQKEVFKNFIKDLADISKDSLKDGKYDNIVDLGFDKGKIKEALDSLEEEIPTLQGVIAKVRAMYKEIFPDEVAQVVKSKLVEIADTTGYSMDKAKKYLIKNGQDMEEWKKNLKKSLEDAEAALINFKKNLAIAEAMGNLSAVASFDESISKLEEEIAFLEKMNEVWDFKTTTSKSQGSRKKDAWVVQMENRIKFMQDFHNGVEKLTKTLVKDSAIIQEQMIMLNRGLQLGLDAKSLTGSSDELVKWYEDAIQKVQDRLGKYGGFKGKSIAEMLVVKSSNATVKELQELLQTLYNALTDFQTNEMVKSMQKNLKDLSEKVSRTKEAKEFFDRMLGLTGDRQLSATLTLSVYGTTGNDLKKLMEAEIREAFRQLPKGEEYDIEKAILGDGKFDYKLLSQWIDELPFDQRATAKSLVENWQKTNRDIIQDIYKSYENFLTFEERKTKVVERESEARKRIMESNIPETEKDKYFKASQKREQKELNDIAIEEFKSSKDWAKSFEDLGNLATPTIERLMIKLKEFIDTRKDLTPEQLKTLMSEYEKLYKGVISRNPFKAMVDGIDDYKKATQSIKNARQDVIEARSNLSLAESRRDSAKESLETATDIHTATIEYENAVSEYEEASKRMADAERGLEDALDSRQKAMNKTMQGLNDASNAISNFSSILSNIIELLGVAEDSEFAEFIKELVKWLGVMSTVLTTIASIIAIIEASLAPVLLALAGLAAGIAALSYALNQDVRRADKQIEILQKHIEDLEYAFERLENAQAKAFGTEYISNYERRLSNLQARLEAYQKQYEAERSKGKKTDEDKLRDYENSIRETKDAIKDMQSELSEHFLGTDLTSAARDFANAWIEAYKEFGSTTDAMKAKFQDMIQNMIVESFAARVIASALEDVFDEIDKSMSDGIFDMSEAAKVANMTDQAIGNIDVGMTNLMNALASAGISVRDMGGNLTGISKDIASASEESILGLAAGINTQNFYISQIPTKIDTIIDLLRGGSSIVQGGVNMQDLMTMQNSYLSSLPTIAQNTAETLARCERIATACESVVGKLDNVIKPRGTKAPYTLNASI